MPLSARTKALSCPESRNSYRDAATLGFPERRSDQDAVTKNGLSHARTRAPRPPHIASPRRPRSCAGPAACGGTAPTPGPRAAQVGGFAHSLSSPSASALRLHTGYTTVSGFRPPTGVCGGGQWRAHDCACARAHLRSSGMLPVFASDSCARPGRFLLARIPKGPLL